MALWDWRRDAFPRSPWQEMDRMMREMGRLRRMFGAQPARGEFPAVNVYSDDERAVVTAEVPGVDRQDLDISVTSDVLTIRGARQPQRLAEEQSYVRQERGYGSFARSVSLPFAVDADAVNAVYENGILRIELPRVEEQKPARIEIKG